MKINKKWLIIIIVVVVVAIGGYVVYMLNTSNNKSTATINNSVVITKTNSNIGNYLADPSGRTLYTYSIDTTDISNCTGSCLSTWPAYVDTGATMGLPTDFGTITRLDDGTMQYTYKGMPLYYFISDSNGQVTGNGVNNFQVAQPSSTTSTSTNNTQSTPSSY